MGFHIAIGFLNPKDKFTHHSLRAIDILCTLVWYANLPSVYKFVC